MSSASVHDYFPAPDHPYEPVRSTWQFPQDSHQATSLPHFNPDPRWWKGRLPSPPYSGTMDGTAMSRPMVQATPAGLPYPKTKHDYPEATVQNPAPATRPQRRKPEELGTTDGKKELGQTADEKLWHSQPNKDTADAIASYLQIPRSVNKSKGSLAVFAAEVRIPFRTSTRPRADHVT